MLTCYSFNSEITCGTWSSYLPTISNIDDHHQFEMAMPQKQFWSNIAPIFARIKKITVLLNPVNFSISDRMDKINFWNPNIVVDFGFPIWGSWLVVTPKGECTFLSAPLAAVKLFPIGCSIPGKPSAGFWLRLHPRQKLPKNLMTAECASHTFMGLPLRLWRSIVCNWRLPKVTNIYVSTVHAQHLSQPIYFILTSCIPRSSLLHASPKHI